MKTQLAMLFTLFAVGLTAVAQDSGAPPAIYMPGADIIAELDRAAASSASAGGWSVSISPGISVRRRSSSVDQYAVVHPLSVEIYRILAHHQAPRGRPLQELDLRALPQRDRARQGRFRSRCSGSPLFRRARLRRLRQPGRDARRHDPLAAARQPGNRHETLSLAHRPHRRTGVLRDGLGPVAASASRPLIR